MGGESVSAGDGDGSDGSGVARVGEVGVGTPVCRPAFIALITLAAVGVARAPIRACLYVEWGLAVWDCMGEIMQGAGRWACVWSGESLGVIVVRALSALDVRRLCWMWSVSLRAFGAVEDAACFRTGVVAGTR